MRSGIDTRSREQVPLIGARPVMERANAHREAAARQIRILFAIVWVPVVGLLAWRVLAADQGSLALRASAVAIFAVGMAVAGFLVVRRTAVPLLLARIDRVGDVAPAGRDGDEHDLALTLECTTVSGAAVVARLPVSGAAVHVAAGDWTLLATGSAGTLSPWKLPAAAVAKLGIEIRR